MSTIRSSTGLIVRALTSIAKELLKNPEAKEPLFRWTLKPQPKPTPNP